MCSGNGCQTSFGDEVPNEEVNAGGFGHLAVIDSMRVASMFKVEHPALFKALDLLLEFSTTDVDDQEDLVDKVITHLNRWKTMNREDQVASLVSAE